MKLIAIILLVPFLISCQAQTNFVKISPENGTMDLMMESGGFGKKGTIQTYFISLIQEDSPFVEKNKRIKLTQGFIVIKLKRELLDRNNPAYVLLDSLNQCNKAFMWDVSKTSNWSDDEKKDILKLRENTYMIRRSFFSHVKFNVESISIKNGISNNAFLTYE